MKKNTLKHKKGFTLIELLVVISIIAVLVALFLANMVEVRKRAADARTRSNLNQLKNAMRLYYNDNGTYPQDSLTDPCDSLNATLSSYINTQLIPQGNQACRYTRTLSGDGFTACVPQQSSAGQEDNDSRTKCGVSDIVTMGGDGSVATQYWYCVCAD